MLDPQPPAWPDRGDDLTREHLLILMLQMAYRRDRALGQLLRPLGLTLPKWRAMMVLRRIGKCSTGELAEFSAVDRTTLTRTIDQMVASGIVVRESVVHDRRQVCLCLTDRGERLTDATYLKVREHNAAVLEGVPPDVIAAAKTLMETSIRNLREPDEDCEHLIAFRRA